ncbi:Hypothetical predicted protein [Pelobates cultripes]|uniref:Uncharacterized protein n=1 Tax=Pelobates cultripes TaxID=61616 RepID=A0AAD1RPK0_PELCU|nr:Hypothetical predicted protein [Pelobates cultripes]
MAQHKAKKNATRADKFTFFAQKTPQTPTGLFPLSQDGADGAEEEGSSHDQIQADDTLTKRHLTRALETLSNKLIESWQHSIDALRRDIQDIGGRTSHLESKMDEVAVAHDDLAAHEESLEDRLALAESRLEDIEDRARLNNLRIRGVPESVQPADLQAYVRGHLGAYAPEVPSDMLLLDRVHRLPRPRHLSDSAPRDILLRAHYFHIKEHILRKNVQHE